MQMLIDYIMDNYHVEDSNPHPRSTARGRAITNFAECHDMTRQHVDSLVNRGGVFYNPSNGKFYTLFKSLS